MFSMGRWGIVTCFADIVYCPTGSCFLCSTMSRPTFINSNVVYHDNSTEYNIDARGKDVDSIIRKCGAEEAKPNNSEDIEPVDTSFFGTDKFPADVCEKNLREAIEGASGKADACRRIMLADTCGYIHIRQYPDARKAELVNPFAAPKYKFTDDDFCKARSRKTSKQCRNLSADK